MAIYQIKRLVDLGAKATVLEAAPDLGGHVGTGTAILARAFDSESYTYGYSFLARAFGRGGTGRRTFPARPENLR